MLRLKRPLHGWSLLALGGPAFLAGAGCSQNADALPTAGGSAGAVAGAGGDRAGATGGSSGAGAGGASGDAGVVAPDGGAGQTGGTGGTVVPVDGRADVARDAGATGAASEGGSGGTARDAGSGASDAGPLPMVCSPRAFGEQGDGTYVNWILPGDYQNTDVVRVGADYYYISATKSLSPGMLVMHSNDMVNWTAIGHVVPDITVFNPGFNFDQMTGEQRGIWAGAIVYHASQFYVYFTTPDDGIYVSTATNPAGPWSALTQMKTAAGWDDPAPFWDDDGQGYLATTNFQIDPTNNKSYNIHLYKLTADGKGLVASSDQIIHQSQGSEANKLFKLNGYYYHFFSEVTSEGRVPMIHRARTIAGPYETHQLNHVTAADREPNQGAILQGPTGDWFFITHHGTSGWEGRPASILPVSWIDDWPVAGRVGADGIGNMVASGKMPVSGFPITMPQSDDDFSSQVLSPQWEWYFQPRADKWSVSERPGYLRLHAFKALTVGELSKTGNVLTQRPLRSDGNVATVSMDISHMADGQSAGLGFLGSTFATVGVTQASGARRFTFNNNGTLTGGAAIGVATSTVELRTAWDATGRATFQFSTDGVAFTQLGGTFQITNVGSFLGAKLAIYTVNQTAETGYVDVDWFRYPCSQ